MIGGLLYQTVNPIFIISSFIYDLRRATHQKVYTGIYRCTIYQLPHVVS